MASKRQHMCTLKPSQGQIGAIHKFPTVLVVVMTMVQKVLPERPESERNKDT